jgi:hypothetical protein
MPEHYLCFFFFYLFIFSQERSSNSNPIRSFNLGFLYKLFSTLHVLLQARTKDPLCQPSMSRLNSFKIEGKYIEKSKDFI